MSDLSYIDQIKFEKLFDMHTWYVLDFSNRTFANFVICAIWVDPYSWDYESKANLLRNIIRKESNYKVWKLLSDLLWYAKDNKLTINNKELHNYCVEIAENLKNNSQINDLNINNLDNDKTLDLLLEEIKNSKDKENPEIILDRLHTLTTKYVRKLSEKYKIQTEWKTLNALFWLYIKELEKKWIIESDITLLIVKSNINILEKFNYIRNNKSLAHDNDILNSNESTFIINNIINLLHFIEKIENDNFKQKDDFLDIPF